MPRFTRDPEFKNLYLDEDTGIYHLRKYLTDRGHLRVSLKESDRKKAIRKMERELSRWLTSKKQNQVLIDEVVDELLDHYEATKARATFESFEISCNVHVLPFFRGWEIRSVAKAISGYVTFQKKKNPKRKLHHDIRCIHRILNYSLKCGYIDGFSRFELDRRERDPAPGREYSNEEIEKILRALNKRHRFQAFIMLSTGMRPGEVRTLKWEYIDFEKRTIALPPEVVKTRTGRTYPIGEQVLEKLFKQKLESKGSYVFPSKLDANTAEIRSTKQWQRAEQKVGFKVRPHWFRHTHATRAVRGGTPIEVICRNLGMSSAVFAKTYFHPSLEDKTRISETVAKTLPQTLAI